MLQDSSTYDNAVYVTTFDEYDAFMQRAAEVELFDTKPYWPTAGDIALHESEFTTKQLVLTFSWLLDSNGEPSTDAERRSQKAMKQYIYRHLKLVENME